MSCERGRRSVEEIDSVTEIKEKIHHKQKQIKKTRIPPCHFLPETTYERAACASNRLPGRDVCMCISVQKVSSPVSAAIRLS